jgi:hypothetical protein
LWQACSEILATFLETLQEKPSLETLFRNLAWELCWKTLFVLDAFHGKHVLVWKPLLILPGTWGKPSLGLLQIFSKAF